MSEPQGQNQHTSSLQPWPPLVGVQRMSSWVLLRDAALTVLAWSTLIWMLRDFEIYAIDMVTPPLFVVTSSHEPDWWQVLIDLRPYLSVTLGLLGLITAIGLLRRRQLSGQQPAGKPLVPLTFEAHLRASTVHRLPDQVWDHAAWTAPSITVAFDAQHRISGLVPPSPDEPKQPDPNQAAINRAAFNLQASDQLSFDRQASNQQVPSQHDD